MDPFDRDTLMRRKGTMKQKRQFVEPLLHEEAALATLTQTLVSGGSAPEPTPPVYECGQLEWIWNPDCR